MLLRKLLAAALPLLLLPSAGAAAAGRYDEINVEAAAPGPAGRQAPRPASAATGDEEAVRRAVEKLARDFNARDAKAAMANFAPDVLLVSPQRPDVGYATMDRGFSEAYAKPLATPYNVVIDVEEVGVSGDLAFVRLTWTRVAKDDGRALRREKDFEVWRRQADGSWKLARGYSFTFEGDYPAGARQAAAKGEKTRTRTRAPASGRGPNADADAGAVRAALENLLRAYNRRDLDAAMRAYAPDALLSYPGTPDSGYAHARGLRAPVRRAAALARHHLLPARRAANVGRPGLRAAALAGRARLGQKDSLKAQGPWGVEATGGRGLAALPRPQLSPAAGAVGRGRAHGKT